MLLKLYDFLGTVLTPVAALATRVAVGIGFFNTGFGKTQRLDKIAEWFASMGIPAPVFHAWFVSYLELIGGVLLIIGLLTRPIAAMLLGTMVVALMTADRIGFLGALGFAKKEGPEGVTVLGDWSFQGLVRPDSGLLDLAAVVFGLLLVWILARGPGVLSVDGILRLVWGGDDKPAKAEKPKDKGSKS